MCLVSAYASDCTSADLWGLYLSVDIDSVSWTYAATVCIGGKVQRDSDNDLWDTTCVLKEMLQDK